MGRLSILLCSLLLVSCSVKKRTTKVSQDIKKEVSIITKVVKQDSIVVKQSSEKVFTKEKSFSYKSLLPILFVFAFIILLRYIVSKFKLI